MKIIYMGTPDFAVPALKALCEAGHDVTAVVTQPDKAKDRGKKIQFTPVKEEAVKRGIPVMQPEKIKGNREFFEEISALKPDLIVVAAYGKILPKEILDLPKLGCVNIHASLLPRYRGATPIHRCIIDGEEKTGVTLMFMEEGLDTGDMIASRETPVSLKTTEELHDDLAQMGAELLIQTLPEIERQTCNRIKQDDSAACYAPMVFKDDGIIDFTRTPQEVCRLIRGLNSWPVARTVYEGKQVKIWEAIAVQRRCDLPPGTIIEASKDGIAVSCGGETILITKLQFPGKRAMSAEDYLKGNEIVIGAVFG